MWQVFILKDILTQSRIERVIYSILTSRVVLDIRAQARDDINSSHVLTELNYDSPSHDQA